MDNNIKSMSYVTYEYDVYPRVVERHASSNITKTSINGADLRILIKSAKPPKTKKNVIVYNILINNYGNKTAYAIKILNVFNNLSFMQGSLIINSCKFKHYDLRDGFYFKSLKPKECINIMFATKANTCGDITSLATGFYYFINDKNEKVYRKTSSNLNKINIDYSYLTFKIQCDKTPLLINTTKNFNVYLKNIGSTEAMKIKFNVLLPHELKLQSDTILVNDKQAILDDKHGFFVENLKENESQKIEFKIEFVEFKNRYIIPIAVFCSFYNINEQNLWEKFDSEICRINVNLMPF